MTGVRRASPFRAHAGLIGAAWDGKIRATMDPPGAAGPRR
jgi:hypothetical protein